MAIEEFAQLVIEERVPNEEGTGYTYQLDTAFSTMSNGHIWMNNLEIIFDDTTIYINVEYNINKSYIARCFKRECRSLEEAIRCILRFNLDNELCIECGELIPRNSDCCKAFKLWTRYHEEEKTCAICQEPVYRFKLGCGHHFHITCITAMEKVKGKTQCPVCRQVLSREELEYIGLESDE